MTLTPAEGAVDSGYSGTQQPVVQNLGPGDLYLGTSSDDLLTEGIQLPPGAVYEWPKVVQEGSGSIWMLADGDDCDIRIINVG
jgi:hypothetical protein